MVRITEQLVRKRSEHNELQISTLEEVSLHQQDIERLEHLDKWCRDLKILYLQSNLIPKIENVSKLKKLEYLNLALNNVERVENLEGCESLTKLDLTVNFVGELTSIECLKNLYHFKELFLTGNPCTDYINYREYVLGTLPQLQWLDGIQIEKSERIQAIQNLPFIKGSILEQQALYFKKRAKQKAEAAAEKEREARKASGDGFDGRWYTDVNKEEPKIVDVTEEENEKERLKLERLEKEKEHQDSVDEFWNQKTAYTPESRIDIHNHLKEIKDKEEKKEELEEKAPRKLFADDGRPYNINEAKLDFSLTEDDVSVILDLAVFRHMDTSNLDCDVQPNYVKLTIKGKIFQLELPVEVNGDSSTAKRSQTTGHLLITMPKVKPIIRPKPLQNSNKNSKPKKENSESNFLEVDASAKKGVDVGNIVADNEAKRNKAAQPFGSKIRRQDITERENSADFEDDPDVPPLD